MNDMKESTEAKVQQVAEKPKPHFLDYTFDQYVLFEHNMKLNDLECKHFSPAAVRFEGERLKIEIDHDGLTIWALLYADEECTIDGKWAQIKDREQIEDLVDALELMDIERILRVVVYELEVIS